MLFQRYKRLARMTTLVVGLCILTLSGCGTASQTALIRKRGLPEVSPKVELSSVPFFPQDRYQCGPAALATVLVNQGVSVTPDELTSRVYLPERKGSLQIEMLAATRQFGLLPYVIKPSLETLIKEIEQGNPVLTLQNLALDVAPQWHYAVVIGYDIEEEEIILRSGETRRWQTSFSVFERTWGRSGFWGFIALKPTEIPAVATMEDYLESVEKMESVGKLNEAITAYLTANHHWPDRALPLFGLGNAAYQAKIYSLSAQAFFDAVTINPDFAMGWNNLAYSLVQLGCGGKATTSVERAIQLDPDNVSFQNSAKDIIALIRSGNGLESCSFSESIPEPLTR